MKKRHPRVYYTLWTIFTVLASGLYLFVVTSYTNEPAAHISPKYPMEDLNAVLEKPEWNEEDYSFLYHQTGLAKPAMDSLLAEGAEGKEILLEIQSDFFAPSDYECEWNSLISKEEHTLGQREAVPLVGLEDGDILITKSSHVGGWRNGHAAIVVDAGEGITLESVVLGTDSKLQDIDKWPTFPNFMVFRLKGASQEERAEIARSAVEYLSGVPYAFAAGVLQPKYQPQGEVTATQCSHLVWLAFFHFGYDIDSDGGMIVTPKDIANSPLLEPVQIYGCDPDSLWP